MSISNQCVGFTKKGTRCKKKVRNGKFCSVHHNEDNIYDVEIDIENEENDKENIPKNKPKETKEDKSKETKEEKKEEYRGPKKCNFDNYGFECTNFCYK